MENVLYVKRFENGKMYVGITNDFERRMREHNKLAKDGNELPIYRAMRKHNHTTEIVFRSNVYEDILAMEKIVIQNFKDLGYELYNMTDGGEGQLGRTGELHPMSKPKEFYETNTVQRSTFKRACKTKGWCYENFEEVDSGEWYIKPNDKREKLYFYIFRDED